MDYMKNALSRTIGSGELLFIRCDKDGDELSEAELSRLNFTNSTIERVVGGAAERIAPIFEASDGIYSDGIITS